MNRWERYDHIEEVNDRLCSLVIEARNYHHDNQSSNVQARLWAKVAQQAALVAQLAAAEATE